MNISEVAPFFLTQCLSNQLNFSVVARMIKIHVSNEAFFLLATVVMVTKNVFFPVPVATVARETNSF